MKLSRVIIWLSGLLAALLLAACSVTGESPRDKLNDYTFPIDPLFEPFYTYLGGEDVLGIPISPLFEAGQYRYQYTDRVLMRFDTQAIPVERYTLAPLGLELKFRETYIFLEDQQGTLVVEGFPIYDEFVPLYEKLERSRFAGKPLTQAHYNPDLNRIEQYFTNVGFYLSLDDPDRTVRLLSYGDWKCNYACRHDPDEESIITRKPLASQPFIKALQRVGLEFPGKPLTEPYLAPDGNLEQIYENVVIYADPGYIRQVNWRPVAILLGYEQAMLTAREFDTSPNMEFVKVDGDLGIHVPTLFMNYILRHGGLEVSGLPITRLFAEGAVYRQCFTNLCLDYNPALPEAERISPAPLGRLYLERFPPPETGLMELTPQNTQLTMWEDSPLIDSTSTQVIHVQFNAANTGTPIPDLQPEMLLYMPDGTVRRLVLPPTNSSGQTSITIPPIQAPNGTLVIYETCLDRTAAIPLCKLDSFVIWGNP